MADATEEVKAMMGGAKVSIKEIQDALWYYYFDVNQAVVYLMGESISFLVPVLCWNGIVGTFFSSSPY